MPPVVGNLVMKELTLQSQGVHDTGNLVMKVEDNAFAMYMGSNLLMSAAPPGIGGLGTLISGDLTVESNLSVGCNLSVESNLSVGGNVTVDSNMHIFGNVLAESNIDIAGDLSVGNNVNITGQIQIGDLNFINQTTTDDLKSTLENISNKYAWSSNIHQEHPFYWTDCCGFQHQYATELPFTQIDGSFNPMMTPMATMYYEINGETNYVANGKFQSNKDTPVPDKDDAYYSVFSMTKIVTSLLYARLVTLGVFQPGDPVLIEDYLPVLKNIKFLVPKYEDKFIPDSSGVNVKDSSGNPYKVPNNKYTNLMNIVGKYVNVYPSRRKAYLWDALAESMGFVSGFADFLYGRTGSIVNPLYPQVNNNQLYGWTAAVEDTSGFVDANGKWKAGNRGTFFGNDVSLTGIYDTANGTTLRYGSGLCYQPALDIGAGINAPTGWNNSLNNLLGLNNNPHNLTPEEHINRFFTDFSGSTYLQLFDHGVYNYTSSGTWSTAVLTKAYNQKFPDASGSYFDILKAELLDPVGATNTAVYCNRADVNNTNSKLHNIATCWNIGIGKGIFQDTSGYTRNPIFDMSLNEPTGYSWNMYNQILGSGVPFAPVFANNALQKPISWRVFKDGTDPTNTGKLYLGDIGLLSTLPEYNKVLGLLKNKGVYHDSSGNLKRLINSSAIAFINIPIVDLLNIQNQQNPLLKLGALPVSNNVAMGHGVTGPTYDRNFNASVISENNLLYDYDDLPSSTYVGDPNPLIPVSSTLGAALSKDTNFWGGASGIQFMCREENNFSIIASQMDTNSQISKFLLNDITIAIDNELSVPGTNSILVGRRRNA